MLTGEEQDPVPKPSWMFYFENHFPWPKGWQGKGPAHPPPFSPRVSMFTQTQDFFGIFFP